jgi:uncharacterized protein (DUF2147 family)
MKRGVIRAGMLFILSIFIVAGICAQNSNQPILGRWHSENSESVILIEEKDGRVFGKIVALKNPNDESGRQKTDLQNPKPELRNQPLIGLTIFQGLRPEGNNKWSGGRIYDPKSGHSYSCEMRLDGNILKIRGYMGISFIGRTTNWHRAK